jgi:serine/threonine protein phosphatase 1
MAIYAIGDIHGRLDKLNNLLLRLSDADRFVFIGDYWDKGADSRGVVDRLLALAALMPCTFLRGNHEFVWLRQIHGEDRQDFLKNYGGRETVRSYAGAHLTDAECDSLIDDIRTLPDVFGAHLDFVERTSFYDFDNAGDWLCVHGGIMPGFEDRDLREHDPEKLVFARFMRTATNDGWRGRYVVCGHTVVGQRPVRQKMAIGIDTGAWADGGRLTALDLDRLEFIQDDGTRDLLGQV